MGKALAMYHKDSYFIPLTDRTMYAYFSVLYHELVARGKANELCPPLPQHYSPHEFLTVVLVHTHQHYKLSIPASFWFAAAFVLGKHISDMNDSVVTYLQILEW